MAQHVAVRALNRSANIKVVDRTGATVKLTPTTDVVVDLDLATNRRALNRHAAVGQWIVTAGNANDGGVALPANS
ncbi:hypothetical protein [Candidatus Solirubrobacter pratensis]|uniref:hypothetical protein n=1 Tax=Candidatus Solirubrobacter pratensis TaxID=1298857 RepID=UPI0003FC00BC|nr:hypothetical protein [Candidatus Solirubrobacter pratensis]